LIAVLRAALVLVVLAASMGAAGGVVACKRNPPGTLAEQGAALYEGTCARCHGKTGAGGPPSFGGGPSPRDFRDHDFQTSRTDEQLKQTIKNGKGTAMPAFGGAFDEQQLNALILQLRAFDAAAARDH
jgi:mono/diheme cytochrome c family protein